MIERRTVRFLACLAVPGAIASAVGVATATEYFQPVTSVAVGRGLVYYDPGDFDLQYGVASDSFFVGTADNDNDFNGPATWTRVGAQDWSNRSTTKDVIATLTQDRNTSSTACLSSTMTFSRYRKSAVAAPGALCATYSDTFVAQAVRSIDTCATGVTRLYASLNLTLNYASEPGISGMVGYRTYLYTSATRPGFAPLTDVSAGCHALLWTDPPICCP